MNTLFSSAKTIHFVGIKGVAMTALALWAKEARHTVTGADVSERFPTDELLARAAIDVHVGFSAEHIRTIHPDLIIYTGAHGGRDNPEVIEAVALGIPVLPHGKALGMVMEGKRQISVAGSHGKTTTSAMLATLFVTCGRDPSYAIGCGEVFGLGMPGHQGAGELFIAEADEYITEPGHDATPRFLWQRPEVLVVTNIDFDHPDAYKSLPAVQEAFVALQKQMSGDTLTIYNADDPHSQILSHQKTSVTFGLEQNATFQIVEVTAENESTHFALLHDGEKVGTFTLNVPGVHNVENAAAALIAGHASGLSWEEMSLALPAFRGTKRRFEYVGMYQGMKVFDDYAHHPMEIRATLAAAKFWYPTRQVIAVFQPHTYSRTQALLPEFAQAFSDADTVLLADIYASAREHDTLGISGATLIAEAQKHHAHVVSTPAYADVFAYLSTHSVKGAIILFMGAGDIYGWSKKIVESDPLRPSASEASE